MDMECLGVTPILQSCKSLAHQIINKEICLNLYNSILLTALIAVNYALATCPPSAFSALSQCPDSSDNSHNNRTEVRAGAEQSTFVCFVIAFPSSWHLAQQLCLSVCVCVFVWGWMAFIIVCGFYMLFFSLFSTHCHWLLRLFFWRCSLHSCGYSTTINNFIH